MFLTVNLQKRFVVSFYYVYAQFLPFSALGMECFPTALVITAHSESHTGSAYRTRIDLFMSSINQVKTLNFSNFNVITALGMQNKARYVNELSFSFA